MPWGRIMAVFYILVIAVPWPVLATSQTVVISELQTGTTAGAGQEFVELYNASDLEVSLEGWKLQYKSATGTTWSQKAVLTGNIAAGGFYLIAPQPYLAAADAFMSDGLAQTAGHVRLLDSNGGVVDVLGWGETANAAETLPAVAPAAGQSLERLPGVANPNGGNWDDTDHNADDFRVRTQPEPQGRPAAIEMPGDYQEETAQPESLATVPVSTDTPAAVVQITELLVDPAPPLSDAADEFIELHNAGSLPVNLKDYRLQTGSNFHDSYTLPELVIPAGGYITLVSAQTKLSLTNSGGAARLLDPVGNVIDETPVYEAAEEGEAWALIGDAWEWTIQTTPAAANLLVKPVLNQKATDSKTTKPKATKSAKSTAAKAKPTGRKAAGKKSATDKPTNILTAAAETSPAKSIGNSWLLWAALGLTIAYGIYEFRHDLQNKYRLLRRKYQARRAGRTAT